MALTTRFTTMLGVRHPVVLAPMGGSAGGALTDLDEARRALDVGGSADGRGVAAALALGAAGAVIGTRFQATAETLAAQTEDALTRALGGER
ncbi:nitronate monooxygenase [Dactylosporangium aurantiacum]|uniref:Nitronate monooxygenase n=1 Tax=Dactylosporangium aurantiacum TaxID=35754 RepID=A0A9Q9I804_9ACTN|nr:nitronate monooxygenase [Dactylosporangium aurantiacum]MDG6106682.1 nitronate monooxygenase [Dactylosporangium aurantiacum]UWZ50836.1 nitronate monooxygenase [Dactylosporangium aurantiacum]